MIVFVEQYERLRAVLGDGEGRLFEHLLVCDEDDVGLGERRFEVGSGGRGGLAHHLHVGPLNGREHRTQSRPGYRRGGYDEHPRRRHAARPEPLAPMSTSTSDTPPLRTTPKRTV